MTNLTRCAVENAVNPSLPLYIDFTEAHQNVVDAAFLAQGLLRAPTALWGSFSEETRQHIVFCMKKQRKMKPEYCNWLCFSAIIEIFLQFAGEETWDAMCVDYALRAHESWYKGDGFYGDGPEFHFDFYNSFVIQPMLVDILQYDKSGQWASMKDTILSRAVRYAKHLEALIMPDGAYPVIGRSSCYRYGAFHALAQAMLCGFSGLNASSVRCALEAVIAKVESTENLFDENGFLTVGVYGHQSQYANSYINTAAVICA